MTTRPQEGQPSIGLITYDHAHLKTEQVVHKLLRSGLRAITIFAMPFSQRPERAVLVQHRPNQSQAVTTRELAAAHGLAFVPYDGKGELDPCDFYLVTGAGILPPSAVRNKRIINAHPGIIPSARGLDAFKWSIHDGIELGITLHYIDEEVDSGEIISIFKTPLYESDTVATLARRHYELEIDVLASFMEYLAGGHVDSYPVGEAHRRMPAEVESEMLRRFDSYKKQFAQHATVKT